MAFFISFSLSLNAEVPLFTSIKRTSEMGLLSTAPGKATKSMGFPTKRTSAGLQGKSGKKGATCSSICPLKTARERFIASLRSFFADFFTTHNETKNPIKKIKTKRKITKRKANGTALKKSKHKIS